MEDNEIAILTDTYNGDIIVNKFGHRFHWNGSYYQCEVFVPNDSIQLTTTCFYIDDIWAD